MGQRRRPRHRDVRPEAPAQWSVPPKLENYLPMREVSPQRCKQFGRAPLLEIRWTFIHAFGLNALDIAGYS